MLETLTLNCESERARIVNFIRTQVAEAGRNMLIVNLSGGIDSALVAALCVEAVGRAHVKAMILPYATSNPESEEHAELMVEKLGIASERFDITGMVRPLLERYPNMDERRKGNIMARCRMIVAFDQSALLNGLVVGTSNRTETLLGYFTLYGDGAASLKPIAHLYKCQIRQLSRHMDIPEAIITKAPSADLWRGQTDEGELGFTYDEADQVLYLLTECGKSVEEIAAWGLACKTVLAIKRRMDSTAFKRCDVPALAPANPIIR